MKKKYILFSLILFLGGFLRFYHLDKNPSGFFADEASVGYNAYSLLKTGHDEHGKFLPIFFEAFGEYKNPVLIYSLIPSIALFGLSEFSTRFVPAVYGALTIVLFFFLTKKLFNSRVALISSFFLAISPWHIHLSRISLEGLAPFIFFLTLSFYLFLVGQKNSRILILSFLFWGITLYTYFPSRLFTPLLLSSSILIYPKPRRNQKLLIFCLLIFGFTALPLVFHLHSGEGLARWNQVSIFADNLTIKQTFLKTAWSYLDHFSLKFLFELGDSGFPNQFITRHSIIGLGQLYWFQLPLLLVGIFYLFRGGLKKEANILLIWLLLYPLGSIFTKAPGPQATRSFAGVVPFQIITALGLWQILEFINNNIPKKAHYIYPVSKLLIFLTISLSFIHFLFRFNEYPLRSSNYWGWQYGPKEIINYFIEVEKNYDELIMSNQFNAPMIFLKFYAPENCQRCKIENINLYDPSKKQLFALPPNDLENKGYNTKKTIYYLNKKIAFKIVEFNYGQ